MFDANQTHATSCYPNLPPGRSTTPRETHSGPQQHSSKRCLCNLFLGHRPCRTTNMAKRKTTTAICKNNHYSNHYSKLPCQLCQFAGAWWGRTYKLLSKLVRSPVFLERPMGLANDHPSQLLQAAPKNGMSETAPKKQMSTKHADTSNHQFPTSIPESELQGHLQDIRYILKNHGFCSII